MESGNSYVIKGHVGSNAFVLQGSGNKVIYGENSRFRFEPFAPAAEHLSVAQAREMPSKLLRAGYETVPFVGREPELAELSAWRDEGLLCSVRLIHGPGGQGKTRLLAAFSQACAAGGWVVWQARLTSDSPLADDAELGSLDTAPGLLVMVDYAERWPVEDLLKLLQTALRSGCRARVVFAARLAGRWWTSVLAELDKMNVQAEALNLRPLGQQVNRHELFTKARDSFATALGVEDAEGIAPPATLDQDDYESVLTVHMAALAAVDARKDGGQAPDDPARISMYLLTRERAQWRKLYERRAVQTTDQLMGQAVFTAILTHPLSDRLGTQALLEAGIVSAVENARQILNDHRLCYPPADKATVLEPLYPDRLGEDFLALETPGSGYDGYDPDPWANDAIGPFLAFEEGTHPPPWTRSAVTVLVAAAERWPHLRPQLSDLIRQTPQVAMAAGGSALAAIAELPDIDIAVLEAIESCFPKGGNVDLDIGIAAVTARLTAHRLDAADEPDEQAALMFTLATRLGNAGDQQGALFAATYAADTYRDLAENDPATYGRGLAKSLTEVGMLSEDPRISLEATQEAVEIYRRRRVEDGPGTDELPLRQSVEQPRQSSSGPIDGFQSGNRWRGDLRAASES